jgi:hypothetical protein
MSVTYLFTTFDFKKILEQAYVNAAMETKNEQKKDSEQHFYLDEVSGEDVRLGQLGQSSAPLSFFEGWASGRAGE